MNRKNKIKEVADSIRLVRLTHIDESIKTVLRSDSNKLIAID